MLHDRRIVEIAEQIARTQIAEPGLQRIVSAPAIDSEGNDALRITVILKPEAVEALTGDAALDLLVSLQNELLNEGEERFPIIEYATEDEFLEGEEEPQTEEDSEDES